jgi:RimJ/RimL family protein N-acetyltransferase
VSVTAIDRIETARMTGERLTVEHADELAQLVCDPRVSCWLSASGQPPSEADIAAGLIDNGGHWDRYGYGLWLLRDRQTGAMVGRGGLHNTHIDGRNEIELAWAVVPDRWGAGLATELALACVALAFEELGMSELIALTQPHNIASRRVMLKAGFVYDRRVVHAGIPHVLYRRATA